MTDTTIQRPRRKRPAGGSGGSSPRVTAAGGSGGSSPRVTAVPSQGGGPAWEVPRRPGVSRTSRDQLVHSGSARPDGRPAPRQTGGAAAAGPHTGLRAPGRQRQAPPEPARQRRPGPAGRPAEPQRRSVPRRPVESRVQGVPLTRPPELRPRRPVVAPRDAAADRVRAPAASPAGRVVPRAPFVLLVLGLLGGSLVCLLVINTTLGAASFRISQLQKKSASLSTQEQNLRQQVAAEQAPAAIAQRAYALGMRAQTSTTILDLRSGQIYRLPGQGGVGVQLGAPVSTPTTSAPAGASKPAPTPTPGAGTRPAPTPTPAPSASSTPAAAKSSP